MVFLVILRDAASAFTRSLDDRQSLLCGLLEQKLSTSVSTRTGDVKRPRLEAVAVSHGF